MYRYSRGLCSLTFCNVECKRAYETKSIEVPCAECGTPATHKQAELRKSKSGNSFCSKSCAVTWNNRQKRKSRRSSCEVLLLDLIRNEFPDLRVLANDKTMLDGLEVDIAMPDISLAVEWNGVVHYQPIYGQQKLDRIQEIDAKKQEIARSKGISLIVVPDLVSTAAKVRSAFVAMRPLIRSAMLDR